MLFLVCLFTCDSQFVNNLKLTKPTNPLVCSQLRVTRRIPIYYLLALGVSAFTGCNYLKGKGGPSADPVGEAGNNFGQSPSKVGNKNNPNLQVGNDSGRVMLVDQGLGFVVVDFGRNVKPLAGLKYLVYRGDKQIGEVTTTNQIDEPYIVADINKGDIRTGDSLQLSKLQPKP